MGLGLGLGLGLLIITLGLGSLRFILGLACLLTILGLACLLTVLTGDALCITGTSIGAISVRSVRRGGSAASWKMTSLQKLGMTNGARITLKTVMLPATVAR